jgi:hypothetical protein
VEDQKKWGYYRRQWRKVYLGTITTMLKIRAIEVTDNAKGDGADDTKGRHEVIAQ